MLTCMNIWKKTSWYYSIDTWDKAYAVQIIEQLGAISVVEVGCGDGAVLEILQKKGCIVRGIELNPDACARCRVRGVDVHSALDGFIGMRFSGIDVLMMLQVLEHISNPMEWMSQYVADLDPKYVLIAVPGSETLLGRTSDPLVWPPHHATLWSRRSLRILMQRLGYQEDRFAYQRCDWGAFNNRLEKEVNRTLRGLPRFPEGRMGRVIHEVGRTFGINWMAREHSILGVYRKAGR